MSGIETDYQRATPATAGDTPAVAAEPAHRTDLTEAGHLTWLTTVKARGWLPLLPILALAGFLNVYELTREGYGNTYYAAAVKSMLESWHNFFFASFDPGGFVTVDKPPLGFWIQAASVRIFGFHGWSLILPQAVAGVLSVVLVFHLVRRVFGQFAGLLAALVLAVMPVAIAANRSNIVDSLLVCSLLLASWAVIHAVETARLRWLLSGMVLVGLAFNIKMLQAYLVVPALVALYLLATRLPWRRRVWHLAVAGVVLLVVSLSWATAVDLTPASQRPYVGSSQDNSEYNLIFGYNGIERLIPRTWSILGFHLSGFGPFGRSRPTSARQPAESGSTSRGAAAGPAGGGPGGVGENGSVGPLRLIDAQLGGQAGWLLPLALLALVALGWQARPRLTSDRRQQALLFWGVWLLTTTIFFSVAGFFHAYYLIMLAPPIAALSGAGIITMWRDFQRPGWRGWLLPVSLLVVALVQTHLLAPYPSWHHRLSPAINIICVVAALALVAVRLLRLLQVRIPDVAAVAAALGMLGLLLAPTAWAAETTLHGGGGLTPVAGPTAQHGGRFAPGGFEPPAAIAREFNRQPGDAFGFAPSAARGGLGGGDQVDSALIQYLLKEQGSTRYLVAVPNANSASPIILATGKPVMALGGFTGSDPILTTSKLAKLVSSGTVRFFLLSGGAGFGGGRFDFSSPERFSGQSPADYGNDAGGTAPFSPFSRDRIQTDEPGTFTGPFGGSDSLTNWVTSNCSLVPSSQWQGTGSGQISGAGFGGGQQLYDCVGAARNSSTG